MIPHKRSIKHRTLAACQKKHNRKVNATRISVEYAIGKIKVYVRLAEPYDETKSEFGDELNVNTGLVNLARLWDKIDKGPSPPGR